MSVLVVAEHRKGKLCFSTLVTVMAARQLDRDIHIVVAGEEVASVVAEAAVLSGVTKVLFAEAPQYAYSLAEPMVALLVSLSHAYSHVLAPATFFGKSILPRFAASQDVAMLSDICGIEDTKTFLRPIYAGSILQTVESLDPLKVITVRTTAFDPVMSGNEEAVIERVPDTTDPGLSRVVLEDLSASHRPDIANARVIVSGGRGLRSADHFKLLETLADHLGAAVGATRAAVDDGFISNAHQIGQTGKHVAPALYIAVGISGAIQHIAGMCHSKVIVAINKDKDAPIFQIADYGLVGDCVEEMSALVAELEKRNLSVSRKAGKPETEGEGL